MSNQEAKYYSFDDYNQNTKQALHYIIKYEHDDEELEDFRELLLDCLPSPTTEWKFILDDCYIYALLKFEYALITPLIRYAIVKSFGEEEIERFKYSKISGMRKADKLFDDELEEIHSETFCLTEKRRVSSVELFNYNREKALFLKGKEKVYMNNQLKNIGNTKSLDEFLEDCLKTFEEGNPPPKK